MLASRLIQRLGKRGIIAPAKARRAAKWISHVEHAGGGVVGVEFLTRHYFSALSLTMFAAAFLVVLVMSGNMEE